MGDYRAYILGMDGHHFVWVEGFLSNHKDDAAALDAAKQLTSEHDVEVWDCGRLVARLLPGGEIWSPDLVPSLVIAPPSDSEETSVGPEPTLSSRDFGIGWNGINRKSSFARLVTALSSPSPCRTPDLR